MAIDRKLLEILVCPEDKSPLEPIELSEALRARLVAHFREQLKDEEPVVETGLRCTSCGRVYPVVSDIPVMLLEEALAPEEVVG